jgi:transcriptional regulator with XRE-family HTH domain
MSKPATRPYSRYTKDAISLMGQLIRAARIERKLTVAALAERASVSRGLVQRIEQGDPGCAVGAVFEIASLLGIKLFDSDQPRLSANSAIVQHTLVLLPKAARRSRKPVHDDF